MGTEISILPKAERGIFMRVIMYGADICPDCVEAKAKLKPAAAIEVDFRDITASTKMLKEFLSFRDHDPLFAPVKAAGGIGIPFFVTEENFKTFEADELLAMV
jgi:glutaredoxin-related protein